MPDTQTTPPQELREAVRHLRAGDYPISEDFFGAVADWLDVKAANLEAVDMAGGGALAPRRDHDWGYALKVARIILGTEDGGA